MAEQTSDKLVAEGQLQLARIRRFNKAVALEKLKGMDPYVFEYLTAALFEHFGYQATASTAGSDEGVDVYLRHGDQLSVAQCKRYDHNIGQPIIRDLYGTMIHNGADEAYLVTTAQFTRQAEEWAENKPIHLVDGFTLVDWIMSTEDGASIPSTLSTPSISPVGMAASGSVPVTPVPVMAGPVMAVSVVSQSVEQPYQADYRDVAPALIADSASEVETERTSRLRGRGLWFWALCSLLVILSGFMAGLFYMRQSQISDSNSAGITEIESHNTEQDKVEDEGQVEVLYEGDVETDGSIVVSDTIVSDDGQSIAIALSRTADLPTTIATLQSTETAAPVTLAPALTATSKPTLKPTLTPTLASTDTPTVEPTSTETATPDVTDTPESRSTMTPTSVPVTPLPTATVTALATRPARNLAGIYTRPPRQGMVMASSEIEPVLDGDLAEWTGDGNSIGSVVAGQDSHAGAADLSGVFWSAWSPEGLYLAVQVVDDVYRSGPDGTDMWMGDGLEIHFDGGLAADFSDSGISEDDYQIGISFGPALDEIRAYLWYPYEQEGTIVIPGNVKRVEAGYLVEIEIPTSILQSAFSQNFLTSNNTFGFNISINDNDSDAVVQETILSWSPARSTYDDPTEWGTLLLR